MSRRPGRFRLNGRVNILMRWEWIVIVYAGYFALIAWSRGYSPALKWGTLGALMSAAVLAILPPPVGTWQTIVPPLAVLLAGYRLSGLFFVAPMVAVEARLLAFDRRMFAAMARTPLPPQRAQDARRGPRRFRLQGAVLDGALELAYLFVYAMVPLGALTLVLAGASSRLPTYWTVVLAACFSSYAVLPWLQTRPPRDFEGQTVRPAGHSVAGEPGGIRRLNLAILRSSSNQVNTLPSGHAAAAVAVALMVLSAAPGIGIAFLAMALAIAVATVAGRYHYTVDTIAGAAVALVCWLCLGR